MLHQTLLGTAQAHARYDAPREVADRGGETIDARGALFIVAGQAGASLIERREERLVGLRRDQARQVKLIELGQQDLPNGGAVGREMGASCGRTFPTLSRATPCGGLLTPPRSPAR
jgi:hypothetical protein